MDLKNLAVTASATDIDPALFLGLPFELPKTEEAGNWLAELDFVDAYDGPLDEVRDLAAKAPSESARGWLTGLVAARERHELFRH